MKRVLVTGGRDYGRFEGAKRQRVFSVLDAYAPCVIIQGGATGADACAKQWAKAYSLPCVEVPARWDEHGKAAGIIRNMQMLDEWHPDVVIAFPGGRGTAHMKTYAEQNGYNVVDASEPFEDQVV